MSTTSEFQVISWLCLSFPEYLKLDSLETHDTLKLDVVAHASYLSIQGQRLMDLWEFKANWVYKPSSRKARALTKRNPVSKNPTPLPPNKKTNQSTKQQQTTNQTNK